MPNGIVADGTTECYDRNIMRERNRGLPSQELLSPQETPKDIARLRVAADKLIERAHKELVKRYDQSDDPWRLAFHGSAHSLVGVRKRTKTILEQLAEAGIHVSERDKIVADVAAVAHDLVQEWTVDDSTKKRLTVEDWIEDPNATGRVMRKRFTKTDMDSSAANEHASAAKILEWIAQQEESKKKRFFTIDDRRHILEAIKATIPRFEPTLLTVVQPYLKQDAHPIALAVALADLGEAGMDPEAFLAGGDALFREENLDMLNLDADTLTDEEQKAYRDRMLGWTKFQSVFANGRKRMLEVEISGLPTQAQVALRRTFNRFDESITLAQARAQTREHLSFNELYKAMGY